MNRLVVNGAFHGQRVTGQQRYAIEVSKRLLAKKGVSQVRPQSIAGSSRLGPWLWVQGPAVRANNTTLLSMTSRAPILRRRHIIVAHDAFPLTNPEWYTRAYVATHAPHLRHLLAHASGVVAVSPATQEAIRPWLGTQTATVVAPNGITPHLATPTDQTRADGLLANFGLSKQRYVLSVGSADPRKNMPTLFAAYASLPEVQRHQVPLAIVGSTNTGVFATGTTVDPLGLHRLGYVNDSELAVLYTNALAFVLPSLNEGFGIPVIEAASHGVPLILSDIPVFRWIAGTHATYFPPRDKDQLAMALQRAMSGNAPNSKGLRGQIISRFNWDTTAQAIYDFAQRIE